MLRKYFLCYKCFMIAANCNVFFKQCLPMSIGIHQLCKRSPFTFLMFSIVCKVRRVIEWNKISWSCFVLIIQYISKSSYYSQFRILSLKTLQNLCILKEEKLIILFIGNFNILRYYKHCETNIYFWNNETGNELFIYISIEPTNWQLYMMEKLY